MDEVNDRIADRERKYAEILALLKDLSRTIGEQLSLAAQPAAARKHNAKAIIKQGMTAYYSGAAHNPFAAGTDDREYWQFGYDNARDTWDEIRK
jgi:hypothetical protein